jgi:hypothetical protein
MLSAIEQLMRHHPAYRFGCGERSESDAETFEELESRHLRRRPAYERERREQPWKIGEMAAAAAMVVVFCGVLTLIARLAADSTDPEQQALVTGSAESPPPR